MSITKVGLVSVTFRQLSPEEILKICNETGVTAVEWGGDVHVPPGDLRTAIDVKKMSKEAGVDIVSYGSYFRLGQPFENFERNLDTAIALDSPAIRIWAGSKSSTEVTEKEREELTAQLVKCANTAARYGIKPALEYHGWSLTDSRESVRRLMRETEGEKDKLLFYWQPRWDWSEEERLASLQELGDRLLYIHVFTWRHDAGKEIRLPLAAGESMWKKIFTQRRDISAALMEFVAEDSPSNFIRDAQILKSWI